MQPDEQADLSALRRPQDPLIDQSNFSVDRLPGLSVVFEQFAEAFMADIAPFCRDGAQLTVERIQTASLFETLNECQGRLAAVAHCPDLDGRAIVIFDRPFVDALAHVTFGARQAQNSSRPAALDRPITRIETALANKVSDAAARALTSGLVGYAETAFALERLEVVADTQILGRRDSMAVLARLRFEAAGASGALIVLMPQSTILPFRQKLSKDPTAETPPNDPRWSKQMKAGVASAFIPVNGVLEELEMTLGEISELAVGHIISLRGDGAGRVKLESAGHNLFWCKLVQTDGRYSLEVEEPVEPEKGLLDSMLSN
jgi:flagellar motor switch protein FliM